MLLRVNPNRMELLRLRRRLVIAKRGHKLLRDKQEELVRFFMGLVRRWQPLRAELEKVLSEAFTELLAAGASMPQSTLEILTSYPKGALFVEIRKKRLLTVQITEFSLKEIPDPLVYGFAGASHSLDKGLLLIKGALPKMVLLAELESKIIHLAGEIERTRRRVNALEYVLIPSILETIRFITMKLSEYERGNLTRLMRVKEIVRAH